MRDIDKEFFEDLSKLSKKIEIFEHNDPIFKSEPDTLNYIKSQAQNFEKNTPILYTHTKGVSHSHPIQRRTKQRCPWPQRKTREAMLREQLDRAALLGS
jgi:hypothetical protein